MTHTNTLPNQQHTVCIVGGGFGGVRCALDLAKAHNPALRIVLVSDQPDFQYYAALYRLVVGGDPSAVCVPLKELLSAKGVEIIIDAITAIDPSLHTLSGRGGAQYTYDTLVLAVGSETAYFGIPGMKESSFSMKSATEALALKEHLHETMSKAVGLPPEEQVKAAHIVVIGGGPTGIELASEMGAYTREIAQRHGMDPSLVTVSLIEAMPRVLPALPENVSRRVEERLRELGVNVFLHRSVVSAKPHSIVLKDMELQSYTIIWTAGVKANGLLATIPGIEVDKKGRVIVDEHLRAKGVDHIFVMGDGAATQYTGMAQTAVQDGTHVSRSILQHLEGKAEQVFSTHKPAFAIPVGKYWAATLYGPITAFGWFGWILRRAADTRAFLTMLPPLRVARLLLKSTKKLESCPQCSKYKK
jgi:NADH dehydrogenase